MGRKNYLIMLGAPKCGTTSLSAWLGQQPYGVLAKQKETLYFTDFADRQWQGPGADFAKNQPLTFEAFDAEFAEKPEAELRIEASTDNFSCASTPEAIARFAERDDVAEIWLTAILRDPVERIVSEYEHTLRMGWQSGSLLTSLQREARRKAQNHHPLFWHVDRSSYATGLARYKELFGERLLLLDFHQLKTPTERERLLHWMGYADQSDAPELVHKNKRDVVARPGAVRFLRNERLLNAARAIVPQGLRPAIRDLVSGGHVDRYEPNDAELAFMGEALADEIQACLEAPDIPTENWRRATAL